MVAWLSPLDITNPEDILGPAVLLSVQGDDDGGTKDAMGRGAVAITVTSDAGQAVSMVTAHLKSKLLTFPGTIGRSTGDAAPGSAEAAHPS
jgi:hypothetical protein